MAPSMPESDRPQKATRVGESDEGNVDLPSRDLIGRWFVAFGGVVGVESPFGVDASLTVVFAGVLAARIIRPRFGSTATTADALTAAVGVHSVGNSSRLPGCVV